MIKKMSCLLMVLLAFGLTSCTSILGYGIKDVEEAFAKIYNSGKVDIEYKVNINETYYNKSFTKRLIVDGRGENSKAIEEYYYDRMIYYIDGYSCTNSNYDSDYYVKPDKFNFDEKCPIFNFDFSKFKYEIATKASIEKIFYTITIKSQKLKNTVENIIEQSIGNRDITLVLEVVVNANTKVLEDLQMNIMLTSNKESIDAQVEVNIKAVGDTVLLNIPAIIKLEIDQYINGSHVTTRPDIYPEIDPEPLPSPWLIVNPTRDYVNTNDGVVKYFDLGMYKEICYDELTNSLIISRDYYIDIYNADTMKLVYQISPTGGPVCLDANNGILAVGTGSLYIDLYDLRNNYEHERILTNEWVYQLVIDGKTLIYADNDQWCDIIFHDYQSNTIKDSESLYQPKLTINRADHILYVTETGISSSDMHYFNSITGEGIYRSNFSEFGYLYDKIIFDGKYVHNDGNCYDPYDARIISTKNINRVYPIASNFTPSMTLYDSNTRALVASYEGYVGVFDNIVDNFIYQFPFIASLVIPRGNGKFIGISKESYHVVIIDTNLIVGDSVQDIKSEQNTESILVSSDKKVKTLTAQSYTKSMADDKYIYLMDRINNRMYIYDLNTLKRVKTFDFLLKPMSFDVAGGTLVIGFGGARQFWVIDTQTFDYEIYSTKEAVDIVTIYQDNIIYAPINLYDTVYKYQIFSKYEELIYQNTSSHTSLAIDRETGKLYIGGDRGLVCYDLKTGKINEVDFRCKYQSGVIFDGNFVHFDGNIFDKTSGEPLQYGEVAREYVEIDSVMIEKTIYDDNEISIYVGKQNDLYVTVIYDIATNSPIYLLDGKSTNVSRVDNTLVLFNNKSETLQILIIK